MASVGDLVKAIAKIEDIDPAQVGRVARYLREADLISMKGRGESAAVMRIADAVNLLIGVNASRIGTAAAETVQKYRRLEVRELRSKLDPRLPAGVLGRFGSALESVLSAYVSGLWPDQIAGHEISPEGQLQFEDGELRVQITFQRPMPAASIRIGVTPDADLGDELETYLVEAIGPTLLMNFYERSHLKHYKSLGRVERTTIDQRTLLAVAECLKND